MIELKMPALSPTMEQGTLARWLVAVGDTVRIGDLLAEVETDKATMEFEAVDEGRIAALVVAAGTEDVPVGTVIALIAQEADGPVPQGGPDGPVTAAADPAPALPPPTPAPRAEPNPAPVGVPPRPDADEARMNVSPLARRIAAAKGRSLAGIAGTGAGGRIVLADLQPAPCAAMPIDAAHQANPMPATPDAPPSGMPVEVVRMSGMRKTIARRLTESKRTIPHFYLTAYCNVDALLTLRASLNDSLDARGTRLSVNDLVIKAMALAMAREPDVNVGFAGDETYRFGRVDIAMAVAIDGGLVTPVIRDAANLSLSAIAERSGQLARSARDGTLRPDEYQGGSASLSNLGMYGIDGMVPVINPPQALILGVGSSIRKPWNVDGAISLASVMIATASFDHRVIDGVAAARFVSAFRDLLENPLQLVC